MQADAIKTEHISNNAVIVHLGAGHCAELEGYLNSDAAKIVLVEANPLIAAALKRRVASFSHVTVIEAAVSQQSSPATLRVFNFADASSLHQPTGLQQLFPGLKTTQELSVNTLTVAELLEPLGLDTALDNLLIIDIPGEEGATLEVLIQQGLLWQFAHIKLHSGVTPLYETSEEISHILQSLQQQGFEVIQHDDHADPDRPSWLLQRNNLKLENLTLKNKLIAQQQVANATQSEQQALVEQMNDLQQQLQTSEQAHAEQQTRAEELTKQLQAAETSKTELTQQIDQHNSALNAANKVKMEQQTRADELAKQLQAAEASKTELTQQRDQHKSALDTANKAKIDQQTRAGELAKQLQAVQHTGQLQQQKIEQLEQQLTDKDFRNQLIDQEMIKAEAQIDLIKDILIREKAF